MIVYDKHNLSLMVISYEIYETSLISYKVTTSVISFYIWSTVNIQYIDCVLFQIGGSGRETGWLERRASLAASVTRSSEAGGIWTDIC